MKRTAIILITFTLLTASSAAVVGHNGSNNSDLSITSGSSASATTGVNQNGTQYTAKVEMNGRSNNQTDNEVRNVNFPQNKVEFEGTVTAGTPCHTVDHELNKTDNSYTLNIVTVKEDPDQVCAEVITGINYDAEFEAEPGFQLEIQHNGETIENVQDRTVEKEPENKSLIEKLLEILGL